MPGKDNILNELAALNSSLAGYNKNPYEVPSGYFDDLAGQLIRRIMALETTGAAEELEILSPYLSALNKANPYVVPAGYFEELDSSFVSIDEARESVYLSPLLKSLKKENPYSVPEGYFNEIKTPVTKRSKLVSLGWVRYAAAAVVTGLIVLAAFFSRKDNEPGMKVLAKVTRDVKKMNEVQKDNLLDFIDAGLNGQESVQVSADKKSEIKSLIQGVPEEELRDFQEQTEDIQDVLMTN